MFSVDYFFNSELCLICFMQFFFIENSSNLFSDEITNNVCPWQGIFDPTNQKNFFRPIRSIFFSKNILVFWNCDAITCFKLSIFGIRNNTVFSIETRFNINRLHFNRSMICVIVLINSIIKQIKINAFLTQLPCVC